MPKITKESSPRKRKRKYVMLLSNHVNRRDDEEISVMAHSEKEARELLKNKFNPSRFSIRGVYLSVDLRGGYA